VIGLALKKLAISASGDMLTRIARFTGKTCVRLDGSPLGPDAAVLVLRSNAANALEEATSVIKEAVSYGVPVIVVAGSLDRTGRALQNAAKKYGVPPECILHVRDTWVVDAFEERVGHALRGGGIGMHTVLAVAERAIDENLIPEMTIWDESDKQEETEEEEFSVWNSEKHTAS
jgi:hypothetical protein